MVDRQAPLKLCFDQACLMVEVANKATIPSVVKVLKKAECYVLSVEASEVEKNRYDQGGCI